MRIYALLFACALAPSAVPTTAAAAQGPLSGRLMCQAVPAPGRVLCEVDLTTARGRLVWADALVVLSPDFARPLRARVGASQEPRSSESELKLSLAFMAVRAGRAPVEIVARAVICPPGVPDAEPKDCGPEFVRLGAELAVGEGL